MKWWKCETDLLTSPALARYVSERGLEGLGFFVALTCAVAAHTCGEGPGLTLPVAAWCARTLCDRRAFFRHLAALRRADVVRSARAGRDISVTVPLLDRSMDEYTRKQKSRKKPASPRGRVRTRSGACPDRVRPDRDRDRDRDPRSDQKEMRSPSSRGGRTGGVERIGSLLGGLGVFPRNPERADRALVDGLVGASGEAAWRPWWTAVVRMLRVSAPEGLGFLEEKLQYVRDCADPMRRRAKDLGVLHAPGKYLVRAATRWCKERRLVWPDFPA